MLALTCRDCQLRPQWTLLAVHHFRAAISQMGAQPGAGLHRLVNLLRAGVCVADGHEHARRARVPDKIPCAGQLGSQRHNADVPFRRLLEFLKFAPIRPSHVLRVVGASRAYG